MPCTVTGDGIADPGVDNTELLERVDAPCVRDEKTQRFLRSHGRVLFLVRGPPGTGRNIVVAELEQLYLENRAYWSDKLFSAPTAPERNKETMRESHALCITKIEGFMKNEVPVIINKNTNAMVWETAKILALASKYGYTVIVVNMPNCFGLNPKALMATNNKGLNETYVTNRAEQWEELYPFATGWSPRPKDAARLLRRFRQLRTALLKKDRNLDLKDVANTCVSPFCPARLCFFGRSKLDHDYCCSEEVRSAYGRSDTLRVCGYAVSEGFVFAMVELSDEQALLTTGRDGVAHGRRDDDGIHAGYATPGPSWWKEVPCTVDIAKFATEGGGGSRREDCLRRGGERINLEDTDASRITFMPLGSVEGTEYSYRGAVSTPWLVLSSNMLCWTELSPLQWPGAKTIAGIDVYGSANKGVLLIVDLAVEMDVVFTGYYLPHATP